MLVGMLLWCWELLMSSLGYLRLNKIKNKYVWKVELTFTALHVTVAPGLPVSSLSDSSGAPDKIFHEHQK